MSEIQFAQDGLKVLTMTGQRQRLRLAKLTEPRMVLDAAKQFNYQLPDGEFLQDTKFYTPSNNDHQHLIFGGTTGMGVLSDDEVANHLIKLYLHASSRGTRLSWGTAPVGSDAEHGAVVYWRASRHFSLHPTVANRTDSLTLQTKSLLDALRELDLRVSVVFAGGPGAVTRILRSDGTRGIVLPNTDQNGFPCTGSVAGMVLQKAIFSSGFLWVQEPEDYTLRVFQLDPKDHYPQRLRRSDRGHVQSWPRHFAMSSLSYHKDIAENLQFVRPGDGPSVACLKCDLCGHRMLNGTPLWTVKYKGKAMKMASPEQDHCICEAQNIKDYINEHSGRIEAKRSYMWTASYMDRILSVVNMHHLLGGRMEMKVATHKGLHSNLTILEVPKGSLRAVKQALAATHEFSVVPGFNPYSDDKWAKWSKFVEGVTKAAQGLVAGSPCGLNIVAAKETE